MCNRGIEYTTHLFFKCNEVVNIWNMIVNWLGFIAIHHDIQLSYTFAVLILWGLIKLETIF